MLFKSSRPAKAEYKSGVFPFQLFLFFDGRVQWIIVNFYLFISGFKLGGVAYLGNKFQHMAEVKIEDIEKNFDSILEKVGQESFVNWDSFTKSSSTLSKKAEELAKTLSILRDIQQRRFIGTMKKLKTNDIPDLIKTVRAKKLPREALRSITSRFTFNGENLQLAVTTESLKEESTKVFEEYNSITEAITAKIAETAAFIQEKIKETGFYEEPVEAKELVSTFKHNFAEDKLEIAKTAIQVEYLPGTVDTLHIKTYAQIVEATLQLVKDEYRRLTIESRIKQRKTFNDPKLYIESLMEYLTNTEVLVLEGQKAIAGKLGFTPQKLEESENALMERGLAQNLLMIQSALRTRVKESMTAEKEATLDQAKEILHFQVNELKSKVEYFKKLFENLERSPENYQLIPMLLALSLNDMVYEKYNLEEEDFMKNVGDNVIMTNPDVMAIFRDMELAIIKLMQELGIISPEAGNYMQAQTQFANSQAPQIPPGGIPPNVNPLEFLQLQQMQQLEQMRKLMEQQQK